ncbi:hypothetical protein MJG53_007915 [Ovis ammon polii x Ovis aries]|uniref:Uncharacterized protein n=1 Tax=Ovis ammon polii x Ovis aries TaxID=2918886 RepID=A0ACB9UYY2_9CETA|nr:hypothetical protein MJG53_007915 [Ovis ammon polii x Ovis aries]
MLLLLISILGMIFAPRDSRGQSLTQPDDPVLVSEGTSLELKCNYSYGATPYVFCYGHFSPCLTFTLFLYDSLLDC